MAAPQISTFPANLSSRLTLSHIASFPRLRALTWEEGVLYAGRGSNLLRADLKGNRIEWRQVASYSPVWWRRLSASTRPSYRLFRDGFHALAMLSSGHSVAAVPGAIITLPPGEREFRLSQRVFRGTRPLHFAVTPDDYVFWGEYFDNAAREEVHIYVSSDLGATWDVAYTFPKRTIRHVHNIVYDTWANCLWVLTGDAESECRIIRASCDFSNVEVVLAGGQQARAAALVPGADGVYFSSDTPLETNYVYRLDRRDRLTQLAPLSSSSIYGGRVGQAIFFSTMVEPSAVNVDRNARLYGSLNGQDWQGLVSWKKDLWPPRWFQYANIFLPDGENTSGVLAASTIAVQSGDLETSLWQVQSQLLHRRSEAFSPCRRFDD
jgi:hypothetical protein